jgi:hypothetical protein
MAEEYGLKSRIYSTDFVSYALHNPGEEVVISIYPLYLLSIYKFHQNNYTILDSAVKKFRYCIATD